MATPQEINADMLAFWNGKGGDTWVARQVHTDITLAPVTDALLAFAAPRTGELPASRSAIVAASARLAPAESPATAMRAGSMPHSPPCVAIQRIAAMQSFSGTGKGCSGASA